MEKSGSSSSSEFEEELENACPVLVANTVARRKRVWVHQEGGMFVSFLQRYSKAPEVPAMWTASTPRAKARAIYQFFPKFCEQFALPEPIPLPPHLTLIFDTVKKTDVVECALEYSEDLLHLGFFSSPDPDKTELLASSLQEFELIKNKKGGEALVMVISKTRNEPLLSLSQFAPIYISPNIEDGDRMRRLFFPTHEEDEDDSTGKDGGINESDASSNGVKQNQDQPEDGKALSGASPPTSTDDQVET
uniref:DUF4746 domain-containing protein n=1 Tax=Timema bartmani TaxID=61472 RepID=A0A7R9HYN0_9NEOP|nr:unnamed protein product [Timema bartmani]